VRTADILGERTEIAGVVAAVAAEAERRTMYNVLQLSSSEEG
jgi:hypothetical protein